MPILTKLVLEEGKDSLIPQGYSTGAPEMLLIDYEDPDYRKDIETIQDIEVGKQLVLYSMFGKDCHRTSKISEILSSSPERVVFKTQTSTYELTK